MLVIPFMYESRREGRCQKKWNSSKCPGNVSISLPLPQGFVCPHFDSPWNLWHWDLSNMNNFASAKRSHHLDFYLRKIKIKTKTTHKKVSCHLSIENTKTFKCFKSFTCLGCELFSAGKYTEKDFTNSLIAFGCLKIMNFRY